MVHANIHFVTLWYDLSLTSVRSGVMTALKRPPTWEESKKTLGDPSFMEKLMKFNKDTLDESMIKKLAKFTNNKEFAPESVGKVSGAARGLCLWVHAMKVRHNLHTLSALAFLIPNTFEINESGYNLFQAGLVLAHLCATYCVAVH